MRKRIIKPVPVVEPPKAKAKAPAFKEADTVIVCQPFSVLAGKARKNARTAARKCRVTWANDQLGWDAVDAFLSTPFALALASGHVPWSERKKIKRIVGMVADVNPTMAGKEGQHSSMRDAMMDEVSASLMSGASVADVRRTVKSWTGKGDRANVQASSYVTDLQVTKNRHGIFPRRGVLTVRVFASGELKCGPVSVRKSRTYYGSRG